MNLLERLAQNPRLHYWEQRLAGRAFYRHVHSLLEKEGAFQTHQRLLEIGCGQGILAEWFKKGGYVGVDTDRESLKFAQRRSPKNHFLCQDASRLTFRDASFDIVLSVGIFHHLDDKELKVHLREAFRVLRDTGKLIVCDSLRPEREDRLRFWWSTLERGKHLRTREKLFEVLTQLQLPLRAFSESKTLLLCHYTLLIPHNPNPILASNAGPGG